MSAPVYKIIPFGPTVSADGNFVVAHGLGRIPYGLEILRTSLHFICLQATWRDATNFYLTASDIGATGEIRCW